MALSLVYFGEHWVTDIVLGWLYVWIVLWVTNRWERASRHRVAAESPVI